jgi:hypothetical protein
MLFAGEIILLQYFMVLEIAILGEYLGISDGQDALA